jgi:ElaB/YqjD/DUF883 family membrane-anchored ribosome-binding protein
MNRSNVVKLREQGESAGKSVTDFVRDHPGAVVAGGVALGLVAGALLSRGSGRKLARHALTIAEVAGTAGLALSRQAMERAEETGDELRRQGGAIADKASQLAEPAEEAVGDAIDTATEAAQRLLRKAVELAGKLRG